MYAYTHAHPYPHTHTYIHRVCYVSFYSVVCSVFIILYTRTHTHKCMYMCGCVIHTCTNIPMCPAFIYPPLCYASVYNLMLCNACLSKTPPPTLCTTHCNTLQHTATHCNTLQCTAAHCNTLQHTATHNIRHDPRQHTATHCKTLQHAATHCNTLQHTATHCNTLRHTATHCDTLQHTATHFTTQHSTRRTATHCNTLQFNATHCNTLQHTANLKQRLNPHAFLHPSTNIPLKLHPSIHTWNNTCTYVHVYIYAYV